MSIIVIKPGECEKAYNLAVDIFCRMYKNITGRTIEISNIDDGKSDVIAIGSDAVNDFVMNEILESRIENLGIRYGTDDYSIKSYKNNGRNIIVLAGGRGRSTIYSVYAYFEKYCGCNYFWDGDVIPKREEIPFENLDVIESPRFEYRGLRYFAHRGLKRFKAEQWTFEDWKQEIDWMMKKRLNFFMLRTGMDDAWQRAFPDIVNYPEKFMDHTDKTGYDDRTDFWPLEYKGELRIKVMDYAKANDLMSPTDCGTMTHWYSRTPEEFLAKKKPKFLEQAVPQYTENDTGKVFDFKERTNMDYYMQLTKTMAKEFDKNDFLFHTIGLGERRVYKENKKNFILKKICYRRIMQSLREEYPNSKLFIATWDFVGWWQPDEVSNFVEELDPERTIILDYTSDGRDEIQNFTKWGMINKIPWIFGIFHAYEGNSELRGPYKRIEERLKIAKEDKMCKGMILWPELVHSDPIVLEYLAVNSWSPLTESVEDIVEMYCRKRYDENADRMNACWQNFLPFMMLGDWGGYTKKETDYGSFATDPHNATHYDLWTRPYDYFGTEEAEYENNFFKEIIPKAKNEVPKLLKVINSLSEINESAKEIFILRDSIDIIKTICGRFLNYMFASVLYKLCDDADIDVIKEYYLRLMKCLSDLLSFNDDYSLIKSFEELKKTEKFNPDFEITLKKNICNEYCKQYCIELFDYVFIKSTEDVFNRMKEYRKTGVSIRKTSDDLNKMYGEFMSVPLNKMKHITNKSITDVMQEICGLISEINNLI